MPYKSRRLPTFLTAAELSALLAAAPSPKAHLYFLFCAKAGLRAFEAAALQWKDIIWKENEPVAVHILQGKGGKEAYLPLHKALAAAILSCGDSGSQNWIFPGRSGGTHITTRAAQYWMEAAAQRAGIPQKARLHNLRHSFATHLLHAGADLKDVQELMRHSSIAVTSVYLHTTPERLEDAVNLLP